MLSYLKCIKKGQTCNLAYVTKLIEANCAFKEEKRSKELQNFLVVENNSHGHEKTKEQENPSILTNFYAMYVSCARRTHDDRCCVKDALMLVL